jgi:hypothetical protein
VSGIDLLAAEMADHRTGWSLGTFGAIAEFTRDPDEPVTFSRGATTLAAVTARGGIRIEPHEAMRLFASESTTRESWSQRVALCLPEDACAMSRRSVLTELGPDTTALREQDRAATLFDLGLDALQADLCVRVADPEVASRLRSCCGWALFAAGNPAMRMILAASPHRVFASRLGRIEVFQPIPNADGASPQGPHTHVLPKLLAHRRTHPATEQVPDGFIPCAHLYPAHPARDAAGHSRPFDRACHEAFQRILRDFGDPASNALKHRVLAAVMAAEEPSAVAVTNGRFARTNVRVALRQLEAESASLPSLARWLAAHDRSDSGEIDQHAGGHD